MIFTIIPTRDPAEILNYLKNKNLSNTIKWKEMN